MDTSGGFAYGGWLVPFAGQDMGTIVNGWFEKADAVLLGRSTYEVVFLYWSQVTNPDNIARVKLTGQPKYIVSSTLRDPPWHDTTVLSGNAIEQVTQLQNRAGSELQIQQRRDVLRLERPSQSARTAAPNGAAAQVGQKLG